MGELINGMEHTDAWNEQLVHATIEAKLDYQVSYVAFKILEAVPTVIPENFTITLGADVCSVLQKWIQGEVDDRLFGPEDDGSNDPKSE